MRRLVIPILVGALCASAGAADDGPPPFPDFTFKSVKAPAPGSMPRIDVQIEPPKPTLRSPPAAVAEGEGEDAPAPGSADGAFGWFWAAVPPEIGAGGPRRWAEATALLSRTSGANSVAAPRLQELQRIADRHGRAILRETVGTPVSPALVLAVIATESSGRTDAVSSAGAEGLMQLIPATAERFGVSDSFAPEENIRGGVAYLAWLLEHFDGDAILALAGYNAGEGAVRDHGGVPPYAETRAYVPKVLAAWQVARGLCLTPPELATDGCVFNVQAAASTR